MSSMGPSTISRTSSVGKQAAAAANPESSGSSSGNAANSASTSSKPAAIRVKNNTISVAVRVRDLNDRERQRHDYESWEACNDHEVALVEEEDVVRVRYKYDNVYNGKSTNNMVYGDVARPVVEAVMEGINGTVFAYGVTSSGKTFTMLGTDAQPGLVPLAIKDVFEMIERMPDREFLLRLSMMEIYNEVINDLLDSANCNLKLKEDKRVGLVIDGLKEETVVSAEHALGVIAAGDAHRKVGSTSYNEYSSRSHTIIRLAIESSPSGDAKGGSRTLALLNLIDLAGSESAKVSYNKDRRLEGGFINKSLLTLGTVMSKLSDGAYGHIPYRDSKLTRMLQGSLTGNGAKIAVVCTITPASSQAEEAHNTLKFANRCKKIEVKARRNEIMSDNSLIMRYQEEIRKLRAELEAYSSYASGGSGSVLGRGGHDPLHPEVRNLRERLEEEKRALVKREQEKASLESRIMRLTRIILHSTKYLHQQGGPLGPLGPVGSLHQRSRSRLTNRSRSNSMLLSPVGSDRGQNSPRGLLLHPSKSHLAISSPRTLMFGGDVDTYTTPLSQLGTPLATPRAYSDFASFGTDSESRSDVRWPGLETASLHDVEGTVNTIRGAGDLFVGDTLLQHCEDFREEQHLLRSHTMEYEFMKEQTSVLAGELCERNQQVDRLLEKVAKLEAVEASWAEKAVELQVLKAECHFIQQQLKDTAAVNTQLQEEVKRLAVEKQAASEAAQSAKELADARERAAKAAEDRLQAAQQLMDATEMKYAAAQAQVAMESLNADMADAKLAMADAKHATEVLKREQAERKAATPMTVYVEVPHDGEANEEFNGYDRALPAPEEGPSIAEMTDEEYAARVEQMQEHGVPHRALPEPSAASELLQLPAPEGQYGEDDSAYASPTGAAESDAAAVPAERSVQYEAPTAPTPQQALLQAREVAQTLLAQQHEQVEVDGVLVQELSNAAAELQQALRALLGDAAPATAAASEDAQEELAMLRAQVQQLQQASDADELATENRTLKLELARLQGSHESATELKTQVETLEKEIETLKQAPLLTPHNQALLSNAVQLQLQNEQLRGDSLQSLNDEQISQLYHDVSHSLERLKVEQQMRRSAVVRAMRRSHGGLTSVLSSGNMKQLDADIADGQKDGQTHRDLQTPEAKPAGGYVKQEGSEIAPGTVDIVAQAAAVTGPLVKEQAEGPAGTPGSLHFVSTDRAAMLQANEQYFEGGFSDNETDSEVSPTGRTITASGSNASLTALPKLPPLYGKTGGEASLNKGALDGVPSTPKLVGDVIIETVDAAFADDL